MIRVQRTGRVEVTKAVRGGKSGGERVKQPLQTLAGQSSDSTVGQVGLQTKDRVASSALRHTSYRQSVKFTGALPLRACPTRFMERVISIVPIS